MQSAVAKPALRGTTLESRAIRNSLLDINGLADRWKKSQDPNGEGLVESIAQDLAAFTGESLPVVLSRMASGTKDFKELWETSLPDIASDAALRAFYSTQFVEAYELANWHVGRTNETFPLNYARAACLVEGLGLKDVLDFGSGIGSGTLCMASAGATVLSADIARELLEFVVFRLTRHGIVSKIIDLSNNERPDLGKFDLITCFDVLEHVPDQRQKIRELATYLKPGGLLALNLMPDSTHPDRPMHISSAGAPLRLIRQSGMRPEWQFFTDEFQVLSKTRFASLRNILASLVE